ncbi:TIGR00341 family protein [Maridesulfovibrio sp.]|uniref:TIGR00341 family protein n=1 Tax=Maridesulfovibrio sp. TaxID=2795000 RepID=UPI0029CA5D95|nr:TIGR00341 family protein [Maridesulfovibrio sp.]
MPLRVIEIIAPHEDKDEVYKTLEEHRPNEGYVFWTSAHEGENSLTFRVIMDVKESENVLDRLENFFTWKDKYRIIVLPVEATIPRLKSIEEIPDPKEAPEKQEKKLKNRLSREELYEDVLDTSVLSRSYILLIIFSSIVAVIGLLKNNVAIIIGAMVLAPLLGPNVGLSLATTLGDDDLAKASSKTLVSGIMLAFAITFIAGTFLVTDISNGPSELMARASTDFSDIILAIVSGSAGIISFTLGVPTSLVGVMVALSLLPPLSACGLFLGAGYISHALGAATLFFANIICLNLSGVVSFLLLGVQPLPWWKREKARITALRIIGVWGVLLAILSALLFFDLLS